MTTHDFKRSSYDSCVYFKKSDDGSFIYLLLYVDDMLIAAKDKEEIRKVKVQIGKEFEMKDVGATKKILRMEILRDRKVAHFKLSSALSPQSDDDVDYMSRVPYSSTVGSFIYAMTIVALSTIEAKYMAITKACKEAIWLKGLFGELSDNLQITMVFCVS
ncbi:Retrovirus-related Pol polyprotein from transposon TNT 1-94 [Vitis vinifera]|uniref:Retrovirus-related Pol polyprotein from transposon TNT 1-94 n=1 Tax=Vitis vinifera TaxID=29760 RepID=A0A438IKM0_VITVI|nr:Retrovirus-related Pol polyprotein from transposon TNT 1-94 [Vitis vinifera]